MNTSSIFSILALMFGATCFVPYITMILKGKTQPMKATWLIWASLDTITIFGMYIENSMNGQIVSAVIGSWTVFFLSLRYGVVGWTRLDKFCLIASAFSILLWGIFESPLLGIIISSVANCIGGLPTIYSAWQNSSRENKLAWIIGTTSSLCALASISEWKIASFIQPIAFLVIQVSMLYLLFVRAKVPAVSMQETI